jgi:hypothetical protein
MKNDPEHFRHFTPREIDRGDFLHDEMRDMRWEREQSAPNNRPQDGRVCNCEDAPCCGHYEL